MFKGVKNIQTLDLGSFDIAKAGYIDDIFKDSKITTVYARTPEDAAALRNSRNKPTGLNVKMK